MKPRLTFFCELDEPNLHELFANPTIINTLLELSASVSLGILDLSSSRAATVKKLNKACIPVIAWLLLPEEQGYWFSVNNVDHAVSFYQEFKKWTDEHQLKWDGIGLDFEPDINDIKQIIENKLGILSIIFPGIFNYRKFRRAQLEYHDLVLKIQNDGNQLESYVFPFIVDERSVRSALLNRAIGLVDVPTNREVMMIYTSIFRPYGPGVLWSYARHSQITAVGITGGGVDLGIGDQKPLDWDEFSRDLRYAWFWNEDVYIFSLEGCVRQGFLDRLLVFEWDYPMITPLEQSNMVDRLRRYSRSALLAITYLPIIIGFTTLLLYLLKLKKKL
jgi:hypothetical protein